MLRIYKYITASLAFAATLSLLVTGELNAAFIFPGIMMIPGYYRYITGKPPVSRWLVAGLALLEMLVLGFDILFVSSDFLVAIAHMTIVFQALKSFDMREPWDPLQVYFMSILQIIITSELSLSVLVGVFFAVFVVLFMAAMVFSHFMKEGELSEVRFFRPMFFITIGALSLTIVLFLSIPRVSGGMWGRKSASGLRSVGFSDNIELGSYGRVLDNPSIVIRAEIEGAKLPLYWRGSTLDSFDGRNWSNTDHSRDRVFKHDGRFNVRQRRAVELSGFTKQKIVVEPLDTNVMFGLGQIQEIEARGWYLYVNDAGSVFMPGKDDRRISYTVTSIPDNGGRDVWHTQMYLQLPGGLDRVGELARRLTKGVSGDREKVEALIAYLNSDFTYTLSPRPPTGDTSPIEWFLFGSREGYCEHFSTALALMSRFLGIPSRIVTGFMGGDENDTGDYIIVRQRNAHSWVEAAIDGKWVRFDPTPLASETGDSYILMTLDNIRMKWYRYVIGFSSYDQITMLSSLTVPVFDTPNISGISISVRPVYIFGFLFLVTCAIILTMRNRKTRRKLSYSTREYMIFRDTLSRRGGHVTDSSTPEEIAVEAIRIKADPEKVSTVTSLYLADRFGRKVLSKGDRELLGVLSRNPFP